MTYLSHRASFHSNEWIAPSKPGIKHLGRADGDWRRLDTVGGVILTLEPWLQMHLENTHSILENAADQCKHYPEIEKVDQVEIAFVAMDDWEYSIRRVDADDFIRALKEQASPKKHGHLLSKSMKKEFGES